MHHLLELCVIQVEIAFEFQRKMGTIYAGFGPPTRGSKGGGAVVLYFER